ncbi:anaerobic ribonucleoside-triphosphate reductase [Vibrio sp. M60_M31a]
MGHIAEPEEFAKARTEKECYDAFQSLEYEVNTLHTAEWANAIRYVWFRFRYKLGISFDPEIDSKNRIAGLGKNRKTAVFPKLVFGIKDGLNHKAEDPNYDIKQLALECCL